MNVLGNLKLSVSSFHAKYAGNEGDCLISATIQVPNSSKLRDVINVLLNVTSVYDVKRVTH
jgi:(p)ppGpp synthase/HD superfamily hydrolase